MIINRNDRVDHVNLPNGEVAASGVFGGYCTQSGAKFCEIVLPPHVRCPNCPLGTPQERTDK